MRRTGGERSIIGRINDMSRALVMAMLVPILISLVLMLVYAGRYHRAIARMEAERRGYTVTGEAEERIREICSVAVRSKEFGNGRFSRNLVEEAIMKAAARVMQAAPAEDLSAYFLLEACDFAVPDGVKPEKSARTIGFSVA